MGLFRYCQSKLKYFALENFIYCLDEVPKLSLNSNSLRLKGWALDKRGPVRLQLRLDGETIYDAWCFTPRFDVARNFAELPHSFLSGFQLDFLFQDIQHIGPGCLSAWIVSDTINEQIWSWEDGHDSALSIEAKANLRKQFDSHASDILTDAHDTTTSQYKLHIVLETEGQYAFLLNAIKKLLEVNFSSTNFDLNSLTVLVSDAVAAGFTREVQNLLSPITEVHNFKINIISRSDFHGWKSLSDNKNDNDNLVLYLHENINIEFLDVIGLLSDFSSLPLISLLMPTLYGGVNGISGPNGVHLSELRSKCFVAGANIPALFATSSIIPVWLTRLSYLISLEKEHQQAGIFPKKNVRILFHLDLRNPVTSHTSVHKGFSLDEKISIEHVIRHELDISVSTTSFEQVVVLLPKDWEDNLLGSGYQYQIQCIAQAFLTSGMQIVFVRDSDEGFISYIDGTPVIPFSLFLNANPNLAKLRWVIATNWDTVKGANVIASLSGAKVINFIQNLEYNYFKTHNRECYEQAEWSYNGFFVPLVNNNIVSNALEHKPSFINGPVTTAFYINKDLFFPFPITKKQTSILLLVGRSRKQSQPTAKQIISLITSLRTKRPSVFISLAYMSSLFDSNDDLHSIVDAKYRDLSAASLARLYSTHEIVIDFGDNYGLDVLPFEVISCGATPLVFSKSSSEEQCSQVLEAFDNPPNITAKSDNAIDTTFVDKLQNAYDELYSQISSNHALRANVSIIIPVHNALDSTTMCIRSLNDFASSNVVEIIIVNDASDKGTTLWLRDIASKDKRITLVECTSNVGFVQACIKGLNASNPENDIVLLNSDVVLSEGSLDKLQDAAYSRFNVGLASSLSTNSPHLQVRLNNGDSLKTAAKKIAELHKPKYPTIITPEGQLLYIRRWVIESFGFFDTVYGRGFCEESDLCMRVFLNGIDMVCADNALIYHRRSASFGQEVRLDYIKQNRPIFDARWKRYYEHLYAAFISSDPLSEVRDRYAYRNVLLEAPIAPFHLSETDIKCGEIEIAGENVGSRKAVLDDVEIVFIMPEVIVGGGSLSVLQHVNELLQRGIEARIISLGHIDIGTYPLLAPVISTSVEELFKLNWTTQKVIATFWTTTYLVKGLKERHSSLDAFYYIQDYEPWFYSRPEHFKRVDEAKRSYSFGLKAVTKTFFLKDLIEQKHHIDVEVITPGVDLKIFYPGDQDIHIGKPRLSVMFRARTSRRGNKAIIEVLRILKSRLPELKVSFFGGSDEIPEDLIDYIELRGTLSQAQVANLYRESDIVLDMSYWHGFGRMGIESMASGVVPVLSQSGGVLRYAVDGGNCFLVDAGDILKAVDRIVLLAKDRELRLRMRAEAINSVKQFSEIHATNDWIKLWNLHNALSGHLEIEQASSYKERTFPQRHVSTEEMENKNRL
jgi:GT2 family glycosyltransferase